MSLIVEKAHFEGLAGALQAIAGKGLYPTTYATDHATAAELHWHNEEVLAYLVQGETYFLDGDNNRYPLQAGDLITVPARTVHAEGDIKEPVVMLIGLREALPMDRFLLPHDPGDLN